MEIRYFAFGPFREHIDHIDHIVVTPPSLSGVCLLRTHQSQQLYYIVRSQKHENVGTSLIKDLAIAYHENKASGDQTVGEQVISKITGRGTFQAIPY